MNLVQANKGGCLKLSCSTSGNFMLLIHHITPRFEQNIIFFLSQTSLLDIGFYPGLTSNSPVGFRRKCMAVCNKNYKLDLGVHMVYLW